MNIVILTGRLTRDPETKALDSGKTVVTFGLAVDRPGKDAGADFIDCTAWEKTGEAIAKFFKKGQPIDIQGEIRTRQYTAKDGKKRTAFGVNVGRWEFVKSDKTRNESEAASEATGEEFISTDDKDLPF